MSGESIRRRLKAWAEPGDERPVIWCSTATTARNRSFMKMGEEKWQRKVLQLPQVEGRGGITRAYSNIGNLLTRTTSSRRY